MRFTCISGVEGRQTHITCEPGDYDGRPPVTTLQVANRMRSLNADRFAVVCALLFAKYVSGAFRIDKEMGPATATALGRFFEPRKLLFEGVSLVPAAIPIGERSALVVADGRTGCDSTPGVVTIGFADDQAFSSYLSPMELRFASNASLFAATPAEKTTALIALATLFADDFSIRRIMSFRTDHDGEECVQRCRQLLSAVNISLEIVD